MDISVDSSIPLSAKVPDAMHSLGSMLDMRSKLQEYQTGQIQQQRQGVQLQQEQGDLAARKAVGAVVSDSQYKLPDGTFDLNRATPAIVQADPQNRVASQIISHLATANNDLLTVKKTALGIADTSRNLIGSTMGAFANRDDLTKGEMGTALQILGEQAPDAKPAIDIWTKHLQNMPDDPKILKNAAMIARAQVMPPATQVSAQTPSGIAVTNQQQSRVINTNPAAAPVGSTIPGTEQQQQLPPTTPVFNAESNTPGYLGPQSARGQPAPSGGVARLDVVQPGHRLQSGPALGAAENVAGTVDVVNKDWADTQAQAKTAGTDISVLQNIKKFAPGAVTGVMADRRAYVAGLAGLLHMEPSQLEKTNTDLLAKNTNMLALAGGDTNLARTMAEGASPNTHMTPEAIQDAANQIIAQRKLAQVKQQYLSHFKGDPQLYTEQLVNFNQIADPRALQLRDMTPEEKMRMKAAMSPSEQKEFGQKVRKMEAMGLIP